MAFTVANRQKNVKGHTWCASDPSRHSYKRPGMILRVAVFVRNFYSLALSGQDPAWWQE